MTFFLCLCSCSQPKHIYLNGSHVACSDEFWCVKIIHWFGPHRLSVGVKVMVEAQVGFFSSATFSIFRNSSDGLTLVLLWTSCPSEAWSLCWSQSPYIPLHLGTPKPFYSHIPQRINHNFIGNPLTLSLRFQFPVLSKNSQQLLNIFPWILIEAFMFSLRLIIKT